jgi:hypothetical protein
MKGSKIMEDMTGRKKMDGMCMRDRGKSVAMMMYTRVNTKAKTRGKDCLEIDQKFHDPIHRAIGRMNKKPAYEPGVPGRKRGVSAGDSRTSVPHAT